MQYKSTLDTLIFYFLSFVLTATWIIDNCRGGILEYTVIILNI
jgi:hypothetical protein